ncbi:MMPL family transporter [Methyloligella sp. 2.7D]|uniref:efflux RND transporter permease subunit n=1 Tax=unclassified Methyloligella TaxID=2625955 RepID=UPI00157D5F3F|nr:MMPL family transporter [Methyloligella sp. GL2]QKP76708.1 MMPL family transporter [Methyloligella sp. GL2]
MSGELRSSTRLYRFTRPLLAVGEWAAHWPIASLIILVVLTAIMGVGVSKLATDDALDQFLRSTTPDYQAFERLRERFPSSDRDVYLTIEGKNLLSPKHLNQMRDLNFDLLLSDPVVSVMSIFSLRAPLSEGGVPEPIIPEELSGDPQQLADIQKRIDTHPLAGGRLLSKPDADGSRLALFVVALSQEAIYEYGLPGVMSQLDEIIQASAAAQDLKIGLAGIPAMKAEVIDRTHKDIRLFNGVGLLVGVVVLGFYFRHIRLVLIAIGPAVLAIIWSLGLFGWSGTLLNPLLNAVMPLVLVVTINNAMHFLFGLCRNLDDGAHKKEAIQKALAEVGPACALTSITTSIALFSLALGNSALIQQFGIMAGVSVIVALILVIGVMPLFAVLFLKEGGPKYLSDGANAGVALLDRATAALSGFVLKWPTTIAVIGTVLTVLFAIGYLQLEPRYRLSDMLPDQGSAAIVADRMEARLGGLFPLSVMVQWPDDETAESPEVRDTIKEVHQVLQQHPAISKVNSLADLQTWAESGGLSPSEASARLMETVPPEIMARYVNEKQHAALVSGYIGDLEAKEVLKIRSELKPALDKVQASHPDIELTLTGLASVGATRSTGIISQLSLSMLGAIAIVIVVIGLAFGSMIFAGLSTIPNLFALFATATWLAFLQGGLDYATIVGLTVAFGLAVDDAIHVLNRFELEMQRSDTTSFAIDRTMRMIGTVLILTTVVLLAGLSITQLSAVPPTRQFGLICLSTLVFALLADLIILPALIMVSSRFVRGRPFSAQSNSVNVALATTHSNDKHSRRPK